MYTGTFSRVNKKTRVTNTMIAVYKHVLTSIFSARATPARRHGRTSRQRPRARRSQTVAPHPPSELRVQLQLQLQLRLRQEDHVTSSAEAQKNNIDAEDGTVAQSVVKAWHVRKERRQKGIQQYCFTTYMVQ